jgi:carbon-monoxide dehydrogenase medium subunit
LKPARFRYCRPETIEEAIDVLREHGEEGRVLAGGQSLIPLMNMRLARPSVIVDVGGLSGLDGVSTNGEIRIGALARQWAVRNDPNVDAQLPILTEALRPGHVGVQMRGTVCGMVAHADPAAEVPGILRLLDGEVVARGPNGERAIPAAEFFVGPFTTTLDPAEIVTEIRLAAIGGRSGWAFAEVARRHGDFAVVGTGAIVRLEESGTIAEARMVLIGVGESPVRNRDVEMLLVGADPHDRAAIAEVARTLASAIDPPADVHGSSSYRKKVAEVLTRRSLEAAVARATGSEERRAP